MLESARLKLASRLRSKAKQLLRLLNLAFFSLCLIFLALIAYQSRENVLDIVSQADVSMLMVSVMCWMLVIAISSFSSYSILRFQHCDISYQFMLGIYLNRIPAKYLPGGIWHTVARAHDLSKKDVGNRAISVLVFYENFWSTFVAAIIGGLGVYYLVGETLWQELGLLSCGVALLSLPVLMIARKRGLIFSFFDHVKLTIVAVSFWVFASLSFYFYIISFPINSLDMSVVNVSANYIFAWLMGFISIFTPQGIGVFEVVFTQLNTLSIPAREAIVMVAGFRFMVLSSELISWALHFFFLKKRSES